MASITEIMKDSSAPKAGTSPALVKGPGGSLTSVSQQELQSRAKSLGMAAPPSSPVGAAGMGAISPDQAKMAGTPNQMNAAIRLSAEGLGPASQQTAQRQEGPRTTSSLEESAKAATASAMQGIGSLQNRVQELVAGKMNQLAQSVVTPAVATEALPEAVAQADVQLLLNPDSTEQQKAEALVRINQAMGRTAAGSQLSAEEIMQFVAKTDGSAIGEAAKAALGTALPMSEVLGADDASTQAAFGLSRDQIAQLLGVALTDLEGMTVQDFQAAIDGKIEGMTGEIESIQYALADPSRSAEEKRELRARLRDLGATGQRSVESSLRKLQDSVDQGDEVTFGGRSMPLEELLGSDYVTGTIARYLNSPEGSEWAKAFAEKEPDLVQWIEESRDALEEATKRLNIDLEDFAKKQDERAKSGELATGNLDDAAMKAIMGDAWNELSASSVALPSVLQLAKTSAPLADELQALAKSGDSALLKELGGLTAAELEQLGITSADPKAKEKWNDWKAMRQLQAELKSADLTKAIGLIFGDGKTTPKSLQDRLSEAYKLQNITGIRADDPIIGLFDSDRDGKLDGLSQLKQNIKALSVDSSSVRSILDGSASGLSTMRSQIAEASKGSGSSSPAIKIGSVLSQFANQSGVIDPKNLAAAADALSAEHSYDEVFSSLWNRPEAKGVLDQMALKAVQPYADVAKAYVVPAKVDAKSVKTLSTSAAELKKQIAEAEKIQSGLARKSQNPMNTRLEAQLKIMRKKLAESEALIEKWDRQQTASSKALRSTIKGR